MRYEVIGLIVVDKDRGTNDNGHDCGSKTYYTTVKDSEGEFFQFLAEEEWDSCGSGWTAASWGEIDYTLKKPEMFLGFTHKPITPISIEVVGHTVRKSMQDTEHFYDATIESVKLSSGEELVSATGNGGCDYYPSGNVKFNMSLFEKV